MIRELDGTDPLDRLYAVLQRADQSQRSTVARRQRLAVHLVGQQRLRVQRAGSVETDVVFAVGRRQADERRVVAVLLDEVRQTTAFRCARVRRVTKKSNMAVISLLIASNTAATRFGNGLPPEKREDETSCRMSCNLTAGRGIQAEVTRGLSVETTRISDTAALVRSQAIPTGNERVP